VNHEDDRDLLGILDVVHDPMRSDDELPKGITVALRNLSA